MCTAVLIGLDPGTPPHLGSYTRALLVSRERLHLFVTPLHLTTMGREDIICFSSEVYLSPDLLVEGEGGGAIKVCGIEHVRT
jgi:hypothetical protein